MSSSASWPGEALFAAPPVTRMQRPSCWGPPDSKRPLQRLEPRSVWQGCATAATQLPRGRDEMIRSNRAGFSVPRDDDGDNLMWKGVLTLMLPALIAGGASAETLSTLSLADGEAAPWGLYDTGVYGQLVSFSDSVLVRSFEFQLDDGDTPISYSVSVHPWASDSVSGPALATYSGLTQGSNGYQNYRVAFDGLPLAEGLPLPAGTYAVLIEAVSPGTAKFATAEGALEPGAWVYLSKDTATGTESWFVSGTSDLAFEMEYEPAVD